MSCEAHGQHQDRGWTVKLQSLVDLEVQEGLVPRARTAAADVQLRLHLKPVTESVTPAAGEVRIWQGQF